MTQKYDIKIECTKCHKTVSASLVMERMKVIDSPGIMLFDWPDGPQCDACLKQTGLDPNMIIEPEWFQKK